MLKFENVAVLHCYSGVTVLHRYSGVTARRLHIAHVGKVWKCGKCPNVMAVLKQSFISVTSVQFYPGF